MAVWNDMLRVRRLAAQVLRDTGAAERYQHDGYTRVDPFAVAGVAAVTVMLRPLEGLLGAFLREVDPGILVNADRPPGLVHMTCAHELGHFFLGHQTTTDRDLDYGPDAAPAEKEADWFAYHLLMPRNLIAMLMRRKGWSAQSLRDPANIYQLSLRLGTSYKATVWTLFHLQLLSIDYAEARSLASLSLQVLKRDLLGIKVDKTIRDVWMLDKTDRDLVLEPRPQDRFVVELPSHAAAGYQWTVDEANDAGFALRPLTVVSESPPAFKEGRTFVGAPYRQRYLLEPQRSLEALVETDRVEVQFDERKPWTTNEVSIDRFGTATEFEAIEVGLSTQARERRIEEVSAT